MSGLIVINTWAIWLDDSLSFKTHVLELAKKVKIKLGAGLDLKLLLDP